MNLQFFQSTLIHRKKGQSLVEFAVALPFLLIILFGIFEAARWFQAYLAVQYAAREATRFAVTGQPPMMIEDGEGSCEDRGVPADLYKKASLLQRRFPLVLFPPS